MPKIYEIKLSQKQYAKVYVSVPDDRDIAEIYGQRQYQKLLQKIEDLRPIWRENSYDDPAIESVEVTTPEDIGNQKVLPILESTKSLENQTTKAV